MALAKEVITEEMFYAATGHHPVADALERVNCPKAGEPLHQCCGWNYTHNCPMFERNDEQES
jgi:hypothetical protein